MRRISVLLVTLLALLLAAGCGQYGKKYAGDDTKEKSADPNSRKVTTEKFDAAAKKRDGCGDVIEHESEGRTHTTSLKEKVDYKTNPPTSGNHYNPPADWGIYDKQQQDEQTVHNLEHGHLVIDYKGLSDTELGKLRSQVDKNPYHLLVQPRKSSPKDGVYYTAWTAMLHCDRPSAPALQYMIDNWRDRGPELLSSDTGGGDMGSGKKE